MSVQHEAGHSQDRSVQHVAALRARLWDGGFRPVAIYNHNSTLTKSPGKAPKGDDWTEKARRNPPAAVVVSPDLEALNTGILCDGLRPLDIDIDNPTIAHSIKAKALSRFGECPMRYRDSGPRVLLLYRAADGQPKKRWVAGSFGKVEVLGRGQQFVAFGTHHSGSTLRWMPEAPGDVTIASLPAITEDDVTAFLAEAALSIGAKPDGFRTDTASPRTSQFGLRADSLQVLTALHSIPNNGPADWEFWNRLGMAIWAATGGSTAGRAAFHAWSEEHPDYDQQETDRRWDHYSTSPPTQIGAGSLFHLARQREPTTAQPEEQQKERADLREFLSIETWIERDIPDPDRLLGDLFTTTTRTLLVGATGLGKTMLGLAVALAMAAGLPFLHWKAGRAARVLYIDGEMPAELIKSRCIDALRRADSPDLLHGSLAIFGRDLEEEAARLFPTLGKMEPLNTEAGQNWLLALIGMLGGVDMVILDNVMSLTTGDKKEESTWNDVLSLVASLTTKRIGQLWIDHTGHDTTRVYGTSTKSWRFDTVGIMAPLSDEERRGDDVAFTLSFTKARRRIPDNRADFEPVTIRLERDRWTADRVGSQPVTQGQVRPARVPFYDALITAITKSAAGPGRTTLEAWELECLHRGLIERQQRDKETWPARATRYRDFRKAKSDLLAAKWIAIEDDMVLDLKGRWA